jgi:uncharacterized membrane protein required for colicin V production
MSLDKLPINLFDCVVLATFVVGLLRGRKHGMSEELIGLAKWLAVVIGCAFLYEPAGQWFASTSPFSLLASFMIVYIAAALAILSIFAFCKNRLGGKLLGSDIFGRAEYYLGMASGVVRVSCVLMAFLALLNARYFTPIEVRAMVKFQDDVYGSNYFPTWHTAQEVVFERSLSGSWIKAHLGFLLIKPTQPEDKAFHQKEANLP